MVFVIRKKQRKCLGGQINALEMRRQLEAREKFLADDAK